MKKFFLYCLVLMSFIFYANAVLADSIDDTSDTSGGVEELYKSVPTVENAFQGQKQITDEDFEKTYQKIKAKKDKKLKKNQPFKGQTLKEEDSGRYIDETAEKELLLGLPVTLETKDGTEIPVGHYKIVGEKINGQIYLEFFQGYTEVARVPALETKNDYGQSSINFVQLIPYNEDLIKLIYGSVDYNVYSYIKIKNGIASQDN